MTVAHFVYSPGLIPDAYIVPMAISYDKMIEGSFAQEQMVKKDMFHMLLCSVRVRTVSEGL